LGLREFADEVHVGIVVDLWIHGISMGYLWDIYGILQIRTHYG
jgi:hypothetical protein